MPSRIATIYMTNVVIDTNFLVALADGRDTWHARALPISNAIPPTHQGIYLDVVINETVAVLGRRLEQQKRSTDFAGIINWLQQRISYEQVVWLAQYTQHYYREILETMVRFQGTVNFHDAMIVLYMRDNGLEYLLSFDADFDNFPDIKRIKSIEKMQQLLAE